MAAHQDVGLAFEVAGLPAIAYLPALRAKDTWVIGRAFDETLADALRLIPCQLVDEGHGSSLQVTVSGRLSRVQRRRDVRARVELPPVSAVRLGPSGAPTGLLGLDVMDLSAGGLRARADEPLAAGDKVRLMLRLDSGQPLTPVMDVLIGGQLAQGRFCPMPERERRRIVQYVYRQELAERQRAQAASPAE